MKDKKYSDGEFHKNEVDNARSIINTRNCGNQTISANCPMQSGKTALAAIVQLLSGERVLWTLSPANNHLYNANQRKIFDLNPKVVCCKVKQALKDIDKIFKKRFSFIFIDEAHLGMGDDSELYQFIRNVKNFYKKNNQSSPCFVFLGATNIQLCHSINGGNTTDLLGQAEALTLSTGPGYFGVADMLRSEHFKIHEPIQGMNHLEDGLLHPTLKEKMDKLLKESDLNNPSCGLIRVSRDKESGEDLARAIEEHFNGEIAAIPINNSPDSDIEQDYQEAVRSSYEKPTMFIPCKGVGIGIRFRSDIKARIRLVVDDMSVTASEAQSFLGRLSGYDCNYKNDIDIFCNEDTLKFIAAFSNDHHVINDDDMEEFGQVNKTIATHLTTSTKTIKEDVKNYYFVIPESYTKSYEVQGFVTEKYREELSLASMGETYFERYWLSPENRIQQILLTEGLKGGGNRITNFHNPDKQSPYLEDENQLREAINEPNHSLTEKILNETGLPPEGLIKAFDDGRLFRLKVRTPCDKTDTSTDNEAFVYYNEN